MLQWRQVRGFNFPDVGVLSGGRCWNWIHRELGQSRPELVLVTDLRRLSGLRLSVSVPFALILFIPFLRLEFLSPDLVVVVDFDRLRSPALQGEDGERQLLIWVSGIFEVFFYCGGDSDFTQSGPLAHLWTRKENVAGTFMKGTK